MEEGTHLRLKTERAAVDSDILTTRDGRVDIWTGGRIDNDLILTSHRMTFLLYLYAMTEATATASDLLIHFFFYKDQQIFFQAEMSLTFSNFQAETSLKCP